MNARTASPSDARGLSRVAYPQAVATPPQPNVRNLSPTGNEVVFGVEEILVTKTDLTGHITYANEVFLRVAGFQEEEVVGQPHSFIRHPDMPRCIFKLLWETIKDGREIFAYVVNLTRDGGHYWVFAHVTPTFDERGSAIGYHSSRRCPDRAQVAKIKPLYETLLAEERRHAKKTDAAAASMKVLDQMLAEQKLSYDEFMFTL